MPTKHGKEAVPKEPLLKKQKRGDTRPPRSIWIDEGGSRQKENIHISDDDDETISERLRRRAASGMQRKPDLFVPRFQ